MDPRASPLAPRDRTDSVPGALLPPASRHAAASARRISAWLRGYPWWPLADALRLLRLVTALLFMGHASMRFVYGSIPQFAQFMASRGFPHGEAWVLAITCYELGAGSLLLLNRGVRWAASGLAVIVAVGIWLIHRHNGWFVGEHGIGGSEYSVALLAMLLVVSAHDAAHKSHPHP